MKISEMIEKLEALKEQHGDIEVAANNSCGHGYIGGVPENYVYVLRYGYKNGPFVYIDAF